MMSTPINTTLATETLFENATEPLSNATGMADVSTNNITTTSSTFVSTLDSLLTTIGQHMSSTTMSAYSYEDDVYDPGDSKNGAYGDASNENGYGYYSYDYNGEYEYDENTTYDYKDYLDNNDRVLADANIKYNYTGFPFEKPTYLYAWPILVFFTTILNIFVVLVLTRKRMRNATNAILIAVAVTDSLTGLITVPMYIQVYAASSDGTLSLSKGWCEAFMVIKFFVARSFHTMSIWLTVLLGFQRFVSVTFPFRANTLFSVSNTIVYIMVIVIASPFVHIYHAFVRKTDIPGICQWGLSDDCEGGCAYIWIMFLLMNSTPCICLVVFSVIMIVTMNQATAKLKQTQMISSVDKLHKRALESRRISLIVIAVVIVFLIPEVPHAIFLLVFMLKHHTGTHMLLPTNRAIICAYEVLVVLSFHANFWIYLIMNRKFREGLNRMVVDPAYSVLAKFGVHRHLRRRSSFTSTSMRTQRSELNTHELATRSGSNSFRRQSSVIADRRSSRSSRSSSEDRRKDRGSAQFEMKTYTFKNAQHVEN